MNEATNNRQTKKKKFETHWNLSLLNINELIKLSIFRIDYRACVSEAEFCTILWYNFTFMVKCYLSPALILSVVSLSLQILALSLFLCCIWRVSCFDSNDLQTYTHSSYIHSHLAQFTAAERWQNDMAVAVISVTAAHKIKALYSILNICLSIIALMFGSYSEN